MSTSAGPAAPRSARGRVLLAVALVAAGLVGTADPASAHATISPSTAEPGQALTLTFQSIVEREALINTEIKAIIPRQWQTTGCAGPATWECAIDRTAYAPHTLVTYTPVLPALPIDIEFSVSVVAPKAAHGSYLIRVLQTHADGWVEPWVYDQEPYPAPRVQVGASTKTVNAEGSREDPPCFGPTKQPRDYGSHDGSAGDPTPCKPRRR